MSIINNFPTTQPTLFFDFAGSENLDSRITFGRNSVARYYDGITTAKAEENLVTNSTTVTSYFTPINAAVVPNATTATNGTVTAFRLTENSAVNLGHYLGRDNLSFPNNTTYTLSVFAKADTRSWVWLGSYDQGGNKIAYFNLATGTTGTVEAGVTASIVNYGNGWYRCITTRTTGASLGLIFPRFGITTGDNVPTYTGDGTSGAFFWAPQIEKRSQVTAYTATTGSAVTNYIPALQIVAANRPRFTHDPITKISSGLLLEAASTNLFTYSETFSDASWIKASVNLASNSVVAPDGTLTGTVLYDNTTTAQRYIFQPVTVSTSTPYVFSCYFKQQTSIRNAALQLTDAPAGGVSYAGNDVNLATGVGTISTSGTFSSVSGGVQAVGNGWYRAWLSILNNNTSTSLTARIFIVQTPFNQNYLGDGYAGAAIWGAQFEQSGSSGAMDLTLVSSYIKTTGAIATRQADSATVISNDFNRSTNQNEGTLFAEYVTQTNSNFAAAFSINSDASNSFDRRTFGYAKHAVNGVAQSDLTVSPPGAGNLCKLALAYKVNDFAACVNGAAPVTDTFGTVPLMTRIFIGEMDNGGFNLRGTVRKFAYYPIRLSNVQIQNLTS